MTRRVSKKKFLVSAGSFAQDQLCNNNGHVLLPKRTIIHTFSTTFHHSFPLFVFFFTFEVVQRILVVFHRRCWWRRRWFEWLKLFMWRRLEIVVWGSELKELVDFVERLIGIESQSVFQVWVISHLHWLTLCFSCLFHLSFWFPIKHSTPTECVRDEADKSSKPLEKLSRVRKTNCFHVLRCHQSWSRVYALVIDTRFVLFCCSLLCP